MQRSAGGIVLPGLGFLAVFFLFPVLVILFKSIHGPHFTLSHYEFIVGSSVYRGVFLNTFELAGVVTAVSLAVGLPVAWYLAVGPRRWCEVVSMVMVLSMWTNLLARTYAWVVLLQDNGPVNKALMALGAITDPLPMMNSLFAVTIGMTYIMVPFVVIPLRNRIASLDPAVFQAAEICGAGRAVIFCRVFFPAIATTFAMTGVTVFVMSLGYYITPTLLGSESSMVLAELIAQLVQSQLDWGAAGAAAFLLLVMTVILYFVQQTLLAKKSATGR